MTRGGVGGCGSAPADFVVGGLLCTCAFSWKYTLCHRPVQ